MSQDSCSKIQNFCTSENNVTLFSYSSQHPNCPASNILLPDQKKIWLTENGLPQFLILDLSKVKTKPQFYSCFGFECWHDYPTNPAIIELLVSKNEKDFVTWTVIHAKLKSGPQFFLIDPLDDSYIFVKISIRETFGAAKTYLNQIFLLSEAPKEILHEESREIAEESNFLIKKDDIFKESANNFKESTNNFKESTNHFKKNEESNIFTKKEEDDILAKYLPPPQPISSEKNKSFLFNSANNSNKKYSASSKNTATKFFDVADKNNTETNWKANNILKYYDKFLNLKAEAQKIQPQNEIGEDIHHNNNNYVLPPKEEMDEKKSEDEIRTLKEEFSKFDQKFIKMQENMEFLIGKQMEMHSSLEGFKEELFSNKAQTEEKNLFEKKAEENNEEENFATGKIYSKLEEFLSRLNEENEKIIEENNNLKSILELKVNNIEEKLQKISERAVQEETFEKKIEVLIEKKIENLSKTMNESIERRNEVLEKKMLLSLKKNTQPQMNSFAYEPEVLLTSNQPKEKSQNNKNQDFRKSKASQSKKNQLNEFFQKLDVRLSQREKELEEIDNELINSKSKATKHRNYYLSSKSGVDQYF